MNSSERMETARVVYAAERMLHRHCVARFTSESPGARRSPALTFPQVNMIMTIRACGGMTVTRLAEELRVKAPAVSAMVERLVEMGVLTRTANPEDRREVIVRVSDRHEAWVCELERRKLQTFAELVDRVGDDCARAWAEVAARIQEALREGEPETVKRRGTVARGARPAKGGTL